MINNDEVNNVTISKIFNKITTFNDDFDEITTTKRCCFKDILTMFDSKNIFNRFDNVMTRLTIFSYFCTKSTISSSFDKFFQTSYSKSYFFHRIKYFDSFFFNLSFVDISFDLEKFNVDNIVFNEHEIQLIKFEFTKKIVKKNKI